MRSMQGFRRIGAATLLAAALGTIAPSSRAEDPPAASAEGTKKAESLFAEGMRFVAQQKWAEAEAKFLAAWSLSPTYDIAANLGQTQYRLSKYREAAEHLAFALRHWPVVGKREPRDLAQKRLEELRPKVGMLRIMVNVAGAMVVVDGREMGRSPLGEEVFVDPGARTVEAKLAGYQGTKQQVEAAAGVELKVEVALALAKPVEAVAGGGSSVTPSATPSSKPSAGAPPPPVVEEGGANRGVLIAGGVAAGVGVSLGVVFAALASSKASDADAQRGALLSAGGANACAGSKSTACTDLVDATNAKGTFANAALWSFVGAGVAGTGTLIYALAAPKKSATAVQVVPLVGTNGGVLQIGGTW